MTAAFAHAPTQAAEFSGPGKHAVVVYTAAWTDELLAVLAEPPTAYEAAWHFEPERRAHVLTVEYNTGSVVRVALLDGVHNALLAKLVKGSALVLSPYPLYREYETQPVDRLFEPESSLALPQLPSPLGA